MKLFNLKTIVLVCLVVVWGVLLYSNSVLARIVRDAEFSNYSLLPQEEFVRMMYDQQGLGLLESTPGQLYNERGSRIVRIKDRRTGKFKLFYTSKFMSQKFYKNIVERLAYALARDFVNLSEVKYIRYNEVEDTQLGEYMLGQDMDALLLVRLGTDYEIEELPQKENSIEGLIAFWTFIGDPEHFVIWDRMSLNKNLHVFPENKEVVISYDHDESHILWPTTTVEEDEMYFYQHCIVWREFFREELSGVKIEEEKIYEMAEKLYNFYKDPENLYRRIRSAGFNPDSALMRIIISKLNQRISDLRTYIDVVLEIISH